ncbi:hypothetical protein FRB95_014625 [Tulasnella sp. JGI-2019a]|nr:hypothetical protein FRB95_014625 [Tulasnella sp. JGI-2019a]
MFPSRTHMVDHVDPPSRQNSRNWIEDWLVFRDFGKMHEYDPAPWCPNITFCSTPEESEPQSAASSSNSSLATGSSVSKRPLWPDDLSPATPSFPDEPSRDLSAVSVALLETLGVPLSPTSPSAGSSKIKGDVTLNMPGSYPWLVDISKQNPVTSSTTHQVGEIDWELLRQVLIEQGNLQGSVESNRLLPGEGARTKPTSVLAPSSSASGLKPLPRKAPPRRTAVCGICQESFHLSADPLLESRSPGSSSTLSPDATFGIAFTCPGEHKYCLDCMTSYIRAKVDPEDETHGGEKFSVRCPECPRDATWRMGDRTAVKLLDGGLLEAWYFQKLLASLEYFSCPDPACAAPIEEPSERLTSHLTEVTCPKCRVDICFRCRKLAHPKRTCSQNAAANVDDRALYELAQRLHWRRCPRCKILVERTEGCRHMTCRCRFEFCHTCGSHWRSKCTRAGGCGGSWRDEELWPEAAVVPTRSTQETRRFKFHSRKINNVCPQQPTPEDQQQQQQQSSGLRQRLKDRLQRAFHPA